MRTIMSSDEVMIAERGTKTCVYDPFSFIVTATEVNTLTETRTEIHVADEERVNRVFTV